MTSERAQRQELVADLISTLSRIGLSAYGNMVKLWQIPLEFAVDEDEGLGVSRTTVFFPPRSAPLRLKCTRVLDVRRNQVVRVSPQLEPEELPPSNGQTEIRVVMPQDLPGALYELTLVAADDSGVDQVSKSYLLYFGRPRATV